MKRRDFFKHALAGAGAAGLAASGLGCYLPESPKHMPRQFAAQCPVCDTEMEEDAYCQECNAIATAIGEYECPACGKVVRMGTYCEKQNAFHFGPSAPRCPKCGKPKGQWCEDCQRYSGLDNVTYCPKCQMPYPATGMPCPTCEPETKEPETKEPETKEPEKP